MKRAISTLFVIAAVCTLASAQRTKVITLNMNSYQAVENFRENITKNPFGLSLSFLWQSNNERFQYGLEYGIAMYSAKEYSYELIEEGRPGQFVDIYEEDCFMKYHAVARYLPYRTPTISTYLEARAGFSSFFSSRTAMEETNLYDDQFEFHGTSFNTAFGGGLMVNMGELFNAGWNTPIYLDLGATFNTGSRADYRNMTGGEVAQGLRHGTYNSTTNSTNYKVGLAFQF